MSKPTVLIQFDPDPQASTFDSIVAVDSGIDHLLVHSAVSAVEMQNLVHGAMFTRGVEDLKHTAMFFGGSNVPQAESLVRAAKKCFFGPMRVSIMSDPNGSNTTAAAAVLSVEKHFPLHGKTATVLAATGPVGQRIAHLVNSLGGTVRVCSRSIQRANDICQQLKTTDAPGTLIPMQTDNSHHSVKAIAGSDVVFAAGAAGVELLSHEWHDMSDKPKLLVDLNAVPPAGIEGIEVVDKGTERFGAICYGAIGVGGLKMKIHRHCIQRLFDANDMVLEIDQIFEQGQTLL